MFCNWKVDILGEVAVRPGKPRAGPIRHIVYRDRLMNEAQAVSSLDFVSAVNRAGIV